MTTVQTVPPPPTVLPGTVLLEKYRVLETIGVGGMGYVVAAEHVGLGKKVALKFLLPQFTVVAELAARFVREARAASRITTENVVRVLDAGTLADGSPYMVMEYLEGADLGRQLRAGRRFAVTEAIEYIVQAATALAHAHAAGIVHRDVKPGNLFVCKRPDGELVKVLDFGISKVIEETTDLSLTKTTSVLGSGLYMSPEQMRSAKDVDARTDVYALGVCMYELLTGTWPYTADTFSELCLKVNLDPPVPIKAHRADVPDGLAAVIEKAYAKKREDRFQTVVDFARALGPYAAPATRARIDALDRSFGGGAALAATASATAQTIEESRSDGRKRSPSGAGTAVVALVGLAVAATAGTVAVMRLRGGGAAAAPEGASTPTAIAAPPPAPPTSTAAATATAPAGDASGSATATSPATASADPPATSASAKRPRVPAPAVSVKLCDFKDPVTGLKDPTRRVPCK